MQHLIQQTLGLKNELLLFQNFFLQSYQSITTGLLQTLMWRAAAVTSNASTRLLRFLSIMALSPMLHLHLSCVLLKLNIMYMLIYYDIPEFQDRKVLLEIYFTLFFFSPLLQVLVLQACQSNSRQSKWTRSPWGRNFPNALSPKVNILVSCIMQLTYSGTYHV